MMRKKNHFFKATALLVLFLCLQACEISDDGVNYHFIPLQITNAEVPEFFELNKTYTIGVTLLKPNDCAYFEGFDISRGGTTIRNVVAVGTELEDAVCAETVEEVSTSFEFICKYTDTYLFRFWTGQDENGQDEFLEIEVPVN